jgi:hypothetical protein
MRFDGSMCSFDHFGMRGKPEIIVGAKVQNGFPVYYDLCALWAGNGPFRFVETGSFYFLNIPSYSVYKIFIHDLKLKHKYNWRRLEPEAHRTPDRVK